MDMKKQADALNVEDELKRLREKSDRSEIMELQRGPFGGYRSKSVAQYVARLKDQLTTSERTYKSHIADLSTEREALKAERDELKTRLSDYETGKAGGGAALLALEGELRLAGQRNASLMAERDALQRQLLERVGSDSPSDAEGDQRAAELEEKLEAEQNLTEEYARKLEDAERKIERMTDEEGQLRVQLADTRQENCGLTTKADTLAREVEGLTQQLGVAKQNILELISDKEELEGVNAELREALNSLVVKADALIRENCAVNAQLDASRAKAQQYQAMHERLSDTLGRVRAAGRMLDERVSELDRSLSFGEGQIASTRAETPRRVTKEELLDFGPGSGDVLRQAVRELDRIETAVASLRQPLPLGREQEPLADSQDEAYSPMESGR